MILEPRTMAHAEELFPLLAEAALYEFIDEDQPESVDALRRKLARSEPRKFRASGRAPGLRRDAAGASRRPDRCPNRPAHAQGPSVMPSRAAP